MLWKDWIGIPVSLPVWHRKPKAQRRSKYYSPILFFSFKASMPLLMSAFLSWINCKQSLGFKLCSSAALIRRFLRRRIRNPRTTNHVKRYIISLMIANDNQAPNGNTTRILFCTLYCLYFRLKFTGKWVSERVSDRSPPCNNSSYIDVDGNYKNLYCWQTFLHFDYRSMNFAQFFH